MILPRRPVCRTRNVDGAPTPRWSCCRTCWPANRSNCAATIPITGTPHDAARRLAAYHRAGADHLVIGFSGGDWRRQCELLAEARALLD
ncbi:hypothetical protein QQG74_19915 [Micromonospora sp. FIMYZ51]|uniref:hypothetical protein n=1 Tax=Micromonospora sp. FIMYZ51 TaxID=3051832 RepID=UPI00311D9243